MPLPLHKILAVIYPVNFEDKIKFTRIRELLKESCSSNMGAEKVDAIRFSDDFSTVSVWLGQTNELLGILSKDENLPTLVFVDVRDALRKIRVEGLFLEEKELYDLRRSLASIRDLVRFINAKSNDEIPHLKQLSQGIEVHPFIIDRIDGVLDKFGKIKDNASPELARIRSAIQAHMATVSRKMQSILRQAKSQGLVDGDATVAIRDGRAVIPVPSANKRKLGGIIHDESATGKTTFIEPAEIVEINNELRELEYADRREVARILTAISDELRPYLPDLFNSYEFLGQMDFLLAKAKFARRTNSMLPQINNTVEFYWEMAVHPLLFLQLESLGQKVVPLKMELNHEQRILLISGPNAGGKSVCLQTVGLLQYMMQCGLLVPMADGSKMGFFTRMFIDMGDEQSIENDLSTYSSHLTNMKHFVRNGNKRTLVLIDEFGTGTEPMLGGAIAESVLAELNRLGVYGVITTHYTNLKHFAAQTQGIVNGAMMFDTHAIQPLFKLEMGKPGSSFAFEIARKIGLPETILTEAKEKIGQDHIDFDKHLREIVRDKRYWEQKRESIRLNDKKLESVLERYQGELEKVQKEKRDIIKQAKADAAKLLADVNRQIETAVREIRESQAEKEKTKLVRDEITQLKQQVETDDVDDSAIERKMQQILERKQRKQERVETEGKGASVAVNPKPAEADLPLAKGDTVKLEGQDVPGEILEIDGKSAMVAFGNLKTLVKMTRLTRISRNAFKKESRQVFQPVVSAVSESVRQKKLNFKPDIDLRGMRADEALQRVIDHIDEAIVCEATSLKILHGKGDGILRKLIRDYLKTMGVVTSFRDEHVQFGGNGITIVELG
jgi:DNA mismatch repair protein MutS2